VASGQDIYAVSAPLAVEAVHRILTGQTRTNGVASAGAIFGAADFLRTLATHISVELRGEPSRRSCHRTNAPAMGPLHPG
jgi:hypothetical protein